MWLLELFVQFVLPCMIGLYSRPQDPWQRRVRAVRVVLFVLAGGATAMLFLAPSSQLAIVALTLLLLGCAVGFRCYRWNDENADQRGEGQLAV